MSGNVYDYIKLPNKPTSVPVGVAEKPAPLSEANNYVDRMQEASQLEARRRVRVPEGVPKARYKATPEIDLPPGMTNVPLIGKDDPDSKKLQEQLIARIRVFDLANSDDLLECTQVWQKVADGLAMISTENVVFDEKNARYLMMLRWSEIAYKLPGS